jgi:DnaJ domain
MPAYSIDVVFACLQLGLDPGVSQEDIDKVLADVIAYRFSTRERIDRVQRLVEFFAARGSLGAPEDSFDEIRKAYHRQAMQLHPDRNRGNPRAEERLKSINAAFAAVDNVYREARDYFLLSEQARRDIEKEAREAAIRERPNDPPAEEAKPEAETEIQDSPTRPITRYMAASIPRFIRIARLGYLRLDSIIGSWFIAKENDLNYVFDVIMLPERQFLRARLYLGVPDSASPSLSRGGFLPAYIPKDVKTIIVPPDEPYPEVYAKNHFIEAFGLDKWKT